MSPSRRLLFGCLALVAVMVGGFALIGALTGSSASASAVDQRTPGPVLLVPGYGGSTSALDVLAARLRASGRQATVVHLPGDGTGDLRDDATVLGRVAEGAVASGAPSVDVVGYSAGGIVARIWAARGGAKLARRIVTLGAPNHGTSVAGLASIFVGTACPLACQQLVPDSSLLHDLDGAPAGSHWLSLWTTQDMTVTPVESARLSGATNLPLQSLCPNLRVSHSDLPRSNQVGNIVVAALSGPTLALPTTCPTF